MQTIKNNQKVVPTTTSNNNVVQGVGGQKVRQGAGEGEVVDNDLSQRMDRINQLTNEFNQMQNYMSKIDFVDSLNGSNAFNLNQKPQPVDGANS